MSQITDRFRRTVRGYGSKNASRIGSAEGSAVGRTRAGAAAAKQLALRSAQRTGLARGR